MSIDSIPDMFVLGNRECLEGCVNGMSRGSPEAGIAEMRDMRGPYKRRGR